MDDTQREGDKKVDSFQSEGKVKLKTLRQSRSKKQKCFEMEKRK